MSRKVLKFAKHASTSDYYKKIFKQNGVILNSMDDFKKIPITSKKAYRNNQYSFLKGDKYSTLDIDYIKRNQSNYKVIDNYLEKYDLNMVITSGSTGEPLEIIHSNRDDVMNYFQLNMFRAKHYNVDVSQKYIWLLPMNKKTKSIFYSNNKNYLEDKNGLQYYLSIYDDESFEEIYSLIIEKKIRWMTGSPSALYRFAQFLNKNFLEIDLDYIELHSEVYTYEQKNYIESTFGIKTLAIYSTNEINFIAAMCENGNYHILDDNVYLEFVDSDLPNDKLKKIVVTGLNYFDSPLLRYEVGDLGYEVECNCCNLKGKPSFKLTNFRDSELIKCKDNLEKEPFCIYDSILFLERDFNIEVGYYQVIQKSYVQFDYHFENIHNWSKKQIADIEKYLTSFMAEGLQNDQTIIRVIDDVGEINSVFRKSKKHTKFKVDFERE